jgi:hypothetical protein
MTAPVTSFSVNVRIITLFTICVIASVAQNLDKPRQLDPLVNVELKVLDRTFRPAHNILLNGKECHIPAGSPLESLYYLEKRLSVSSLRELRS